MLCIANGTAVTHSTNNQTLLMKLERLLSKCKVEHHMELMTAIAEYMASNNLPWTIANEDDSTALIASTIRLKHVCRHPSNITESYALLKRYNQTSDVLEKMLILRIFYSLRKSNNANASIKCGIKLAEQDCRHSCGKLTEDEYFDKIGKNVLPHKWTRNVCNAENRRTSNEEFVRILNTMEIHTGNLEKIHRMDIDYQLYSNQINKIVNCLKRFQK